MKKYVIIDKRMRDKEKEYLNKIGYNTLEINYHPEVYEEISSHVDIFVCKINNNIFIAPNIKEIELQNKTIGKSKVLEKYPLI